MNSYSVDGELAKMQQKVRNDLDVLAKWTQAARLRFPMTEVDFLLFLHRNNYNVKDTKINIENFFGLRSSTPEFFWYKDTLFSSRLNKIVENVSVVVQPNCTPKGYFVVVLKLLNYNPKVYDFAQAVKYLNMVLDVHVYENGISPGYFFVCDVQGSTPEHFDRLPIWSLAKYIEYLNIGAHFRWKGLRFINTDPYAQSINNYVQSKIIDTKVDAKIYFHKTTIGLSKAVPLWFLPVEMGGTTGHLHELHEAQVKKIHDVGKYMLLQFVNKKPKPGRKNLKKK